MPKLTFTNAKGLVQESGSGEFNLSGEAAFYGAKKRVHPSLVNGVASLTASMGTCGTTFNLGSSGGNTSFALPEMSADNIGYNCRLIVTGALDPTHVVQTVTPAGVSATSDRFLLSVTAIDGTETDKVTTTSNKLSILTGCADGDDAAVLDIEYIAANKAIVKGIVLT